MRAHLLVETKRGEILVDEDVNDVRIANMVTWWSWEKGEERPSMMDRELLASGTVEPRTESEHQVSMSDLARIEITPCRDRPSPQDR